MIHPYASAAYARVFEGVAEPLWVEAWGAHVLTREIAGGGHDALGVYPLAPFGLGADLKAGLAWLQGQGLVSVGLVPDPATAPPLAELQDSFGLCAPFKTHLLVDYGREVRFSRHHRAEVKKALRQVTVEVVPLAGRLDAWCALYDTLIDRHEIGGLSAFSRGAFERMAQVEDLTAVAAFAEGEIVSMHLWLTDPVAKTGYSLLAASSSEGYRRSAAYAVYDHSIRLFSDLTCLNLGGGAGLQAEDDGLSFFKRGFANDEIQAWFCGAILDEARYAALSGGATTPATPFPAYRFASAPSVAVNHEAALVAPGIRGDGVGEAVLIFPAGMAQGLAFRDRARQLGMRVIGASSVDGDPARDQYETWEDLPYVNDPGFDTALADLVRRHGISIVHTPHFVVWRHLSEHLAEIAPSAQLSSADLPEDHERAYQALRARVAAATPPVFEAAFPPKPALSALERTGLIRLIDTIPGMCGEPKMHAIVEMMRHAPDGDIVEIGSWWGRSAGLFAWLSNRYGLGKLLCIDPWLVAANPQGDALLDKVSAELDTEEALRMFEINLAPLAGGRVNYIRALSDDAAELYRPGLVVRTEAFGETAFEGAIAVLHIDGNHAEHHAQRDADLYIPHVVPGGWIIFDDYEWAFGDGPRVVADAFVAANAARIAAVFQAGPALFIQLRRPADG